MPPKSHVPITEPDTECIGPHGGKAGRQAVTGRRNGGDDENQGKNAQSNDHNRDTCPKLVGPDIPPGKG